MTNTKLYMVTRLITSLHVNIGHELTFEPLGHYGVMPVFKTKKEANKYAKRFKISGQIIELSTREDL